MTATLQTPQQAGTAACSTLQKDIPLFPGWDMPAGRKPRCGSLDEGSITSPIRVGKNQREQTRNKAGLNLGICGRIYPAPQPLLSSLSQYSQHSCPAQGARAATDKGRAGG